MGRRTVAVVVAAVFALAAAALVWWYVASVRTEVEEGEVTQTVLVAREDIPARTTGEAIVERGLSERVQMPARLVAPGGLTDEQQLRDLVLTTDVAKGQQLVAGQLGTPEEESLTYQIKTGMRAISVPIDRVRGVAGTITPGDRVDVLATFEYEIVNRASANVRLLLAQAESDKIQQEKEFDPAGSQGDVTRVLLQQIEVLAVDPLVAELGGGGFAGRGDDVGLPDDPVVTLMVTPQDAELLIFAQEIGTVWFALVPSEDTESVTTPGRAVINVFPR